jgi:hypothetical protein
MASGSSDPKLDPKNTEAAAGTVGFQGTGQATLRYESYLLLTIFL